MITYTAKENDVLDWIVWKHYGTTTVLDQVMEANPTVADEHLKAGTVVKLPYFDATQKSSTEVRLWS